jgi:hypothetical protein
MNPPGDSRGGLEPSALFAVDANSPAFLTRALAISGRRRDFVLMSEYGE